MNAKRVLRALAGVLGLGGLALLLLGRMGWGFGLLGASVLLLLGSARGTGTTSAPDDDPSEEEPPREPLEGTVTIEGRPWRVREEKRSGPNPQLLVLWDPQVSSSVMHVRPVAGQEAHSLDEAASLARRPAYRWFVVDGVRWQARTVLYLEENGRQVPFIKFISDAGVVVEGRYRRLEGLGVHSEDELANLLHGTRRAMEAEDDSRAG